MRARLLVLAAVLLLSAAPDAQAVVCTGTTNTVNSGDSVQGSFLLTAGNCVAAGDKIFGQFSVGGAITGAGNSSFSWVFNPGSVTLGFAGVVSPNTTGFIDYKVALNPALAQNFQIIGLEKDFTLSTTGGGTATLTGFTNPASINFSCTRPTPSTCPQTAFFAPVDALTVNETITVDGEAFVTAITDKIFQAQAISEPDSLAILAGALLGMALVARRRRGVG